jgi:hypothetical protein
MEEVLKKILKLVVAYLKWLTACPGSQACLGVHLSIYLKFEIRCPPRYLVKHKNMHL